MPAAVGVVAIVAVLVTLAVYPAPWRSFRAEWRRIPPERRPRALAGRAAALALGAVAAVLAIAAPSGRYSVVYVPLIGGHDDVKGNPPLFI